MTLRSSADQSEPPFEQFQRVQASIQSFLNLVPQHGARFRGQRILASPVGVADFAEETKVLLPQLRELLSRLEAARDLRSQDTVARGLMEDDLLLPSVSEAVAAMASHGHDQNEESEHPRGSGGDWIENECVEPILEATLHVASRVIGRAMLAAAGVTAPARHQNAEPKTALNSALSGIETKGRQFLHAIQDLENRRAAGSIPVADCKASLVFVTREDPPEVRLNLEIELARMEQVSLLPWERSRGVAARCVWALVQRINDAKSHIDDVREFTDNQNVPELERWSSQLRLELNAAMDALKLGCDPSAWTPPLASALGAGVVEAFKKALDALRVRREHLRVIRGSAPMRPTRPPIPVLTATELEQRIDSEHRSSGLTAAEAALHICLVNLPHIYTAIPIWTTLNEDRKSKAATMISMLNAMAQAEAASGPFRPSSSLHEMKELKADAGIPAMPDAITIAQNGAILIERAKQAVQKGAVGRMDSVLNPGAHACRVEVATRLHAAESTFAMLVLCLQNGTLRMDEAIQKCEADRAWLSEFHGRFLSALAVPTREASASQAGSLPAAKAESKQADYEFRKDGQVWRVTFRGVTGSFADSVGMKYISALLTHPNPDQAIESLDLCPSPRVQTNGGRDEIVDMEGMRLIQERLVELKEDREQAIEDDNLQQISEIDDEVKKIQEEIRLHIAKGGASRGLRAVRTPAQAAREGIWSAIQRVLTKFRDPEASLSPLADHLDATLKREGTAFAYRPGKSRLDWTL